MLTVERMRVDGSTQVASTRELTAPRMRAETNDRRSTQATHCARAPPRKPYRDEPAKAVVMRQLPAEYRGTGPRRRPSLGDALAVLGPSCAATSPQRRVFTDWFGIASD